MARVSVSRPPARAVLLAVLATLAALLLSAVSARAATVTVAPGDTLGAIAARNGTSVAALAAANGIADPDLIHAGRTLTVPGGGGGWGAAPSSSGASYTVRPGDTLGGIAARNGVGVSALAALNGIRNPDVISVGKVLSIPAAGPAPVVTPSYPSGGANVGAMIADSAARHGVDPALARAVAWQESRWNQGAVSSVGAVGVMQLMPGTARWFGPAVLGRRLNPHLVQDNIEGGVAYLGWLQRHSGSTRTAIAAYYQGLSSLRRRGAYDDTKAYVRSVLSFVGRV
jgi:soluble lytic murein transglycosylase-like protein